MRAALLSQYHTPLELIERPDPEPMGPRSVVVKIAGAGVCQTDLHTIDGHMEPAGVRLPLIVREPGQEEGVRNNAMVSWTDIAPTILDWCGVKPPPVGKKAVAMAGRSNIAATG